MRDLYNLKNMLVEELAEFGRKGELSKTSLDTIDKIAHATKNIGKDIEGCEQEEYSGRSYRGRSYESGNNSYRGYSRSGDDVREELDKLMHSVNDDRTREELRKIMNRF